MATTSFSTYDEYGFETPPDLNYKNREEFLSQYIQVLAKRSKRWEDIKCNQFKRSNLMKRFVRKGIPSNQRCKAWFILSGAESLQHEANLSYQQMLKDIPKDEAICEIISIDIPRTFPNNVFFTKNSPLPKQLYNILHTFAQNNSDVGYCQGLNYIAGLLLLSTKDEQISYWLLKVLIEGILPQYYVKNMSGLLIDLDVLEELVQKYEPQVSQHVKAIGMPWAVATTKWFICLYAEVLPIETVYRIWDCLFYEGSKIIFRVALALIRIHRTQILATKDLSELVTCFRDMGNSESVTHCHRFMEEIFKSPSSFPNNQLKKLRLKHGNKR